jgi:eukaryotic-like serine/threonine-protein kinase
MPNAQEGAPSARTPSSQGPDPLIGRVINDRFRIVSLMARGGMGKVYRAEQAPLGRQVALKILHPNYSGDTDPEFHKRFFLEASTCSKLTHPNTVTIFDYGRTDDDIYYIAMELLEGRTLHRTLREEGPLSPQRASHIARQICRSLREAHGLGVIHRDLKPANIFLVRHGDEADVVKVLDFGLVKDVESNAEDLTQTGLFMGSPKYMAPEQIRGEKVDVRADIYALGVILYEMLTGKVPFDRPNSVNILMAHVHEPPPPFRVTNPNVEVPPALEDLVMRALSKQPEERHAGMDDLLAALKQVAMDGTASLTRSADLTMSGEFAALPRTSGHPPAVVVTTGSIPVASGTPSSAIPILAPEPARKGPPIAIIGAAVGAIVLVTIVLVVAIGFGGSSG